MIELAQHIEALLLENDCVIVPNLGGFVAHYTPSTVMKEDYVRIPPTRMIGFNPRLKMNDGLLVQSYAAVYGTSFSDATRMVEKQVDHLLNLLHEEGKADLPNVGELHYSIYGSFSFTPYDYKLTTPYFYGIESFTMKPLSTLPKPAAKSLQLPLPEPAHIPAKRRTMRIHLKRSYLSNVVAIVAVAMLFFLFSTPIENTRVVEENYAHLLPSELFEKMGTPSLLFTPVTVQQQKNSSHTPIKKKQPVAPIVVKEIKVKTLPASCENKATSMSEKNASSSPKVSTSTPSVKEAKPKETPKKVTRPTVLKYHIIVASVSSEKDAHAMAAQLQKQGYKGARAIIGNGKMRVSIESCSEQQAAYSALNQIRSNDSYKSAWVLKQSLSN